MTDKNLLVIELIPETGHYSVGLYSDSKQTTLVPSNWIQGEDDRDTRKQTIKRFFGDWSEAELLFNDCNSIDEFIRRMDIELSDIENVKPFKF